jgi:UPF0271 protein
MPHTLKVDLNCDLGESFGRYQLGFDEQVMDFITSANIACGFHAGDPATMRRTAELARRKKVAVGAHPGFPDLPGFGRRNMDVSAEEAYDLVLYQIGALDAFARREGLKLQHVKPHGALYNMAVGSAPLAEALVKATRDYDQGLVFVGLPLSEMENAARRFRVRFAAEVFADRTYQPDGSLTSRREAHAFVEDPTEAAARVVTMVREKRVQAVTGQWISIRADTICLHGDNPKAVSFIERIHKALKESGLEIAPLAHWLA